MATHGRLPNLSFFAFTATPKAKTLEMFGTPDASGIPHAFHIYSMKPVSYTHLSKATLEVVGRDQPDQRLYLSKDQESLVWELDHAENELWKQPPDPVLEAVAKIVSADNREWEGSPTELAQAIQTDMAVNRLTKHLNVNASRLLEEHQVQYENKTKHAEMCIRDRSRTA